MYIEIDIQQQKDNVIFMKQIPDYYFPMNVEFRSNVGSVNFMLHSYIRPGHGAFKSIVDGDTSEVNLTDGGLWDITIN